MGRPVVCFIDDSAFERDNFTRHFPPAVPGWQFVITDTWNEARKELAGTSCLLFLLDLYGFDPDHPDRGEITPLDEIKSSVLDLEGVGDNLEAAPDPINEFLKRLHTVTSSWSEAFVRASRQAGQSRAYGLYNLARVREEFPGATAVAYSRKASSADLVSFLMAGGQGALLKPQGKTDDQIGRATGEEAPILFNHLLGLTCRTSADFLLRETLQLDSERATYLRQFARSLLGRTPPPARQVHFSKDMEAYLDEVCDWLTALGADR